MYTKEMQDTYRTRLEDNRCYVGLSEIMQEIVDEEVRRVGVENPGKVAHGLLALCVDVNKPTCTPWLIAPDKPAKDMLGGRHSFVYREFNDLADDHGLRSFSKGTDHSVDYDDLIGTYVVRSDESPIPITVICEPIKPDETSTPEAIDLIAEFTSVYDDHQVLMSVDGNDSPRKYLNIIGGSATEIPYGFFRGKEIETVAESHDLIGKVRELDNYALYAELHGLNQFEFDVLVEKAVNAFRNGIQVSLDTLCQEILTEKNRPVI